MTTEPSNQPPAAASPRAQPFFFPSGGRPLYGVYYPPERRREGAPVVVHCHSLGVEQLTAYRTEALLARRAAALGFPVFRYHSRGHGDSGGDFAEVTFASLVEDALTAAAVAMERAGPRPVLWLGVRFGALVAAGASARRGAGAGLALWEPTVRPRDFFRAQLRGFLFSQVAKGKKPDKGADELLQTVLQDGRLDVHGYYLHAGVVRSTLELDLKEILSEWTGPTLVVQIQERQALAPGIAALTQRLEAQGSRVETARVVHEPAWSFVTNPAWEGDDVARITAGWLDALA